MPQSSIIQKVLLLHWISLSVQSPSEHAFDQLMSVIFECSPWNFLSEALPHTGLQFTAVFELHLLHARHEPIPHCSGVSCLWFDASLLCITCSFAFLSSSVSWFLACLRDLEELLLRFVLFFGSIKEYHSRDKHFKWINNFLLFYKAKESSCEELWRQRVISEESKGWKID